MLNYNVIKGAPGMRLLPLQQHLTARAGGLMLLPFSAIASGLSTSLNFSGLNGATGATLANLTLSVNAGTCYLDGEMSAYLNATAGTADSITISGDPASTSAYRIDFNSLVFGYNEMNIYLNPTRLVIPWVGASLPTSTGGTTAVNVNRLNGNVVQVGDIIAHCADNAGFLSAHSFWIVTGVAAGTVPGTPGAISLVKYDPSFAPPTREGRMRTWGNHMEKIVRASNISLREESRVFIGTKYPPYVNSNSEALLRDPASLLLGTFRFFAYRFPIEIRLDITAGQTNIPLDPETATILANATGLSVRGRTPSAVAALGAARAITISGNNLVLAAAAVSSMNDALCEIVATQDAANTVMTRPFAASAALSSYTPANNFV